MKKILFILCLAICTKNLIADSALDRETRIHNIVTLAINKFNTVYHYWDLAEKRHFIVMPVTDALFVVSMTRSEKDTIPLQKLKDKNQSDYVFSVRYNSQDGWGRVDQLSFFNSSQRLDFRNSPIDNFGISPASFYLDRKYFTATDYKNFKNGLNCIKWSGKLSKISYPLNEKSRLQLISKIEQSIDFCLKGDTQLTTPLPEHECTQPIEWVDLKYLEGARLVLPDIDPTILYASSGGIICFNDPMHYLAPWCIDTENSEKKDLTISEIVISMSSAVYTSDAEQKEMRKKLQKLKEKKYLEWEIIKAGKDYKLKRVNF